MGFFSSTCAKTHLPILASVGWDREAPRLTHIVVVPPHGDPYEAVYDGYGLGGDGCDFDELKLVLASDYKGERYEDLGPSEPEPNQGYFHYPEFIAALLPCPGFASHSGYEDALFEFEQAADALDTELLTLHQLPTGAKSYRVTQALSRLHDGEQVTADALDGVATELPADVLLGRLREVADSFMTQRTLRLTELATTLVQQHQLPPAQ